MKVSRSAKASPPARKIKGWNAIGDIAARVVTKSKLSKARSLPSPVAVQS